MTEFRNVFKELRQARGLTQALIVSQHLRKSTLLSLFVAYLYIMKARNPRHLLSVGDLKLHRACPLVLTSMHLLHGVSNSSVRP